MQGKQKSVVNTVPNPKWLLPNCNPIKVRLVYLSSSGLFITVQMAATFGRLSSSLPAARHAKLSSTESGPAPVRGLGNGRPPLAVQRAHSGLVQPTFPRPLPPPPHRPVLTVSRPLQSGEGGGLLEQVAAHSPLHCASGSGGHTWCQPLITPRGSCSRERRASSKGPYGGRQSGVWHPDAQCQAAQNKGALWGATSDSGWKIKPGKIKGKARRKDSPRSPACVQRETQSMKNCSRSRLVRSRRHTWASCDHVGSGEAGEAQSAPWEGARAGHPRVSDPELLLPHWKHSLRGWRGRGERLGLGPSTAMAREIRPVLGAGSQLASGSQEAAFLATWSPAIACVHVCMCVHVWRGLNDLPQADGRGPGDTCNQGTAKPAGHDLCPLDHNPGNRTPQKPLPRVPQAVRCRLSN